MIYKNRSLFAFGNVELCLGFHSTLSMQIWDICVYCQKIFNRHVQFFCDHRRRLVLTRTVQLASAALYDHPFLCLTRAYKYLRLRQQLMIAYMMPRPLRVDAIACRARADARCAASRGHRQRKCSAPICTAAVGDVAAPSKSTVVPVERQIPPPVRRVSLGRPKALHCCVRSPKCATIAPESWVIDLITSAHNHSDQV